MPITILQPAAADNYIQDNLPNQNNGSNTGINVGEWNGGAARNRTLIKFDLTSIPPGARVRTATLSLYQYTEASSNDRTLRVYRQKRQWVESQSTWNIYSTGNNWQTAGGFGVDDCEQTDIGSRAFGSAEANGWKDWALDPGAIEAMISGSFENNGFLMRADTEVNDEYRFRSSDYTTDALLRPKLTIDWEEPVGRLAHYRVNALAGGVRISSTIERIATRAWARYTPIGGSQTKTAEIDEAAALLRWGILHEVFSGGNVSAVVAEQAVRTWLRMNSDPAMPDVELFGDIVVLDQYGERVPLEEILPNRWLVLEGLPAIGGDVPTSLQAQSIYVYIENVDYDESQGEPSASIQSGRDKFAEAMVNRLMGRSGG